MWELAHYTTYCPSCSQDAAVYQKRVEKIQTFEFLARLNPDYEQIKIQILNMGHPLNLNEVYAHIHHEEGRCGVMTPTSSIEKSALVSSSSRGGRGSFMGNGRGCRSTYSSDDRDRLKYEQCGCFKHTKDQCWDLHGRPPNLAS